MHRPYNFVSFLCWLQFEQQAEHNTLITYEELKRTKRFFHPQWCRWRVVTLLFPLQSVVTVRPAKNTESYTFLFILKFLYFELLLSIHAPDLSFVVIFLVAIFVLNPLTFKLKVTKEMQQYQFFIKFFLQTVDIYKCVCIFKSFHNLNPRWRQIDIWFMLEII